MSFLPLPILSLLLLFAISVEMASGKPCQDTTASQLELFNINDDGTVEVIESHGNSWNVKLPGGELEKQIREAFMNNNRGIRVTVLTKCGVESIVSFKLDE